MAISADAKAMVVELQRVDCAGAGAQRWTGRVLGGLAILFLTFDAVVKLLRLAPAVEGTAELGFPAGVLVLLGVALRVIAYAVPRTSVLGAVLLTGYLGGAVAAQVRVGNPLFSHALFPVYVAMLVWGGSFLRDPRVRALSPP